jgi:hypothetical protein
MQADRQIPGKDAGSRLSGTLGRPWQLFKTTNQFLYLLHPLCHILQAHCETCEREREREREKERERKRGKVRRGKRPGGEVK